MRPLPLPPTTAVVKDEGLSYPQQPHPTTTVTATSTTCGGPDDTCNNKLKPYSNDFEANAAVILIVLFCALICALTLHTAIRCFLLRDNNSYGRRRYSGSPQNRSHQQQQVNKPSDEAAAAAAAASLAAAPTLVYSAGGMKLTGAEVECVICLSEFIEGDVIQVLEKCKHGFHMQCIQKWLCSHHYSCPICRCNCLLSSPTSVSNHDSNGS